MIRYCGAVTLRVQCVDTGGMGQRPEYRVAFSSLGRHMGAVRVRLSWEDARRLAIDSREAGDKVAHAALSFAGREVRDLADPAENGWHIHRHRC